MRSLTLTLTILTILLGARTSAALQKPRRPAPPPPPPPARTGAQAPLSRAEQSNLRRLVELTGVVEKELRSVDVVMEMFKKQSPNVPDTVWVEVRKEFEKGFNRETIITMYTSVYSNFFDAAEVRQLIAFYASPVGRKLISSTPLIEVEVFLKGAERGADMGERIRQILKGKGYAVPAT